MTTKRAVTMFKTLAFAVTACACLSASVAYGEVFTIAVIPDAQLETHDSRMRDRLEWLVANSTNLNLKMVLQVGDLMNFNDETQYVDQSRAYEVLDRAGIPHAIALGNHDTAAVRVDGGSAAPGNVNLNLRNTERFNRHFPTNRFTALVETFESGKIDNSVHKFSAGGEDWLVVQLELWARPAAVEWAKSIAEKYPHSKIIFLTHAHLLANSSIQQDNGGYGDKSPQYVFEQAMKPYANVCMVFSGHTGGHGYRVDKGDHGNLIHQFLQCYHDGKNNPVRLLTIDTDKNEISTHVYSPSSNTTKEDGSAMTVKLSD